MVIFTHRLATSCLCLCASRKEEISEFSSQSDDREDWAASECTKLLVKFCMNSNTNPLNYSVLRAVLHFLLIFSSLHERRQEEAEQRLQRSRPCPLKWPQTHPAYLHHQKAPQTPDKFSRQADSVSSSKNLNRTEQKRKGRPQRPWSRVQFQTILTVVAVMGIDWRAQRGLWCSTLNQSGCISTGGSPQRAAGSAKAPSRAEPAVALLIMTKHSEHFI